MKNIIISEGHNDSLFWECLMEKLGFNDEKIKYFSVEQLKMDEKKHAETIIIKSFVDPNPYNYYDYLIKLEGGKDPAKKIFSRELIYWLDHIKKLILLLDLDTLTIDEKIDEIKKHIEETHLQTTPLLLTFQLVCKHDHLYHYKCTVFMESSSEELGSFELVLFKISLEYSCDISKEDGNQEKFNKIKSFIEKEEVCRFFNPIFSG